MTIIAEFRVQGDRVALLDALASAPGLTLELERSLGGRDGRIDLFLWASDGDLDRFEAALPDDPTVRSFEVVERRGGERLYRITPEQSETADFASLDREVGASRLSLRADHRGVELRTRFPDQAALGRYFDNLREEGFEVDLLNVFQNGDRDDEPARYGLSEKQLEALQRALATGYYEVPRETDLSDLADDLGVSRQAASERLRRGTARLLRNTLGEPEE